MFDVFSNVEEEDEEEEEKKKKVEADPHPS